MGFSAMLVAIIVEVIAAKVFVLIPIRWQNFGR